MNTIDTKGFTLLEMLLALFIFAMLISVIFTSYTGTFRNIEETESRADIYQMARIVLERMQEDLESVYISEKAAASKSEFLGEDAEINGRSADTLGFTSRAHLVFNEEDEDAWTARIVYYVEESDEDEHDESLVLYRADTPELKKPPEEGTGGLVLCEGLFSVNLTYHDADGEVHDTWDPTSKPEERLPKMVSIVLEFVNKSNPEAPLKFMTGVALPMGRDI